jgi:hypothetical protein
MQCTVGALSDPTAGLHADTASALSHWDGRNKINSTVTSFPHPDAEGSSGSTCLSVS